LIHRELPLKNPLGWPYLRFEAGVGDLVAAVGVRGRRKGGHTCIFDHAKVSLLEGAIRENNFREVKQWLLNCC
jgi:hypothetical protein